MKRESESEVASGVLHVVSTPIGNLGDMTYRAVEALREADVILAEDTRRTRVLLDHYGIRGASVRSMHQHNEAARAEEARVALEAGSKLALVSDSGTPLLSDPGLRLIRVALAAGARIVPVPGASAVLAALVASGLDPEPFTFFGFPPRSGKARAELIALLRKIGHTAVLYESPQRLQGTLEELRDELGAGRAVAVARELTKVHEEFVRGTLDEAVAYYATNPPRGEVVICLAGAMHEVAAADIDAARAHARGMVEEGATSKTIVRALRERFGLERNRAYELSLEAREGEHE